MLSAQTPERAVPEFEVASVKPSPPNLPTVREMGGLRLPPGRWRAIRVNLVQLIGVAYISRRPCRADGVSFFTALKEQTALKLEPSRESVDVLVIDSVERPRAD